MSERLTKGLWAGFAAAMVGSWIAGLSGCAASKDDAWIDALRAREAEALPQREVGSADGAFAAHAPAVAGDIEPGEEADYVTLGIGTDTPIECALYHDEVESASTVQTSADQVFAGLEERYGAPVERSIERLDAGAIGASPFLQVYWRYRVAGKKGEVLGELKQMIANREGRSVYCVLHDNGFARSFDRVVRDLVGSMRFSSYDELRPYFTQIHVLSTEGRRFGFVTTAVTLEEDGEPRIVRYSAQLTTNADGGLSARDVTSVEHSTVGGMLRGKIFTDYQNGEIASVLVLEDSAEGWEVSGEKAGVATRAVFEPVDLWSWLGDTGAIARVAAGDAGETSTRVWEPQLDANASIERRFSRMQALPDGLRRVSVYTGSAQSVAAVDSDGLIRSETDVDVSPAVLRERVFVEGSLR